MSATTFLLGARSPLSRALWATFPPWSPSPDQRTCLCLNVTAENLEPSLNPRSGGKQGLISSPTNRVFLVKTHDGAESRSNGPSPPPPGCNPVVALGPFLKVELLLRWPRHVQPLILESGASVCHCSWEPLSPLPVPFHCEGLQMKRRLETLLGGSFVSSVNGLNTWSNLVSSRQTLLLPSPSTDELLSVLECSSHTPGSPEPARWAPLSATENPGPAHCGLRLSCSGR